MGIFGESKEIKDYRRLRAAGRTLVGKINDAIMPLRFDIVKAAKKLTLPVQGRTIIFDDGELDSAALMDFLWHEFRAGGRRPIDCCDPDAMDLSGDERDLLAAHKAARTSLFEVAAADRRTGRVTLRNVIEPDRPDVLLSDLSMSSSQDVAGRVLVFVRVVECQGIAMTSGLFFTFSAELRERLVSAYRERMKMVEASERSQRALIFFFQRHRECGEAQAFAETET